MDDRCSRPDYDTLLMSADTVVPFKSYGMTEHGYKVTRRIRSDFALMIADDEQPSPLLWDFAASPPSPSRFGIPVVPILGGRYMSGHIGLQERLVWLEGWGIVPRIKADGEATLFDGDFESPAPKVQLLTDATPFNAGLLIWHHLLEAPRSEREAKARRYASFDNSGDHTTRLFWEEQPESLIAIPDEMRQHLPKGERHGERKVRVKDDDAPARAGR